MDLISNVYFSQTATNRDAFLPVAGLNAKWSDEAHKRNLMRRLDLVECSTSWFKGSIILAFVRVRVGGSRSDMDSYTEKFYRNIKYLKGFIFINNIKKRMQKQSGRNSKHEYYG